MARVMAEAQAAAAVSGWRWVVLDCAVTRVLGRFETFGEAEGAARGFGGCSFPYELSDAEVAALDAA